jgi:Arabinose efflux permease
MKKRTSTFLLVIFSLGFIMAVLDTTGVVLAIPQIEKYLNIPLSQSVWVANSYILALGALLLLSGNLTAKYGAKRILIIGMSIFSLASLSCSFAVNLEMLIISRFIQGFGASLFMPSSLALLFMSYPDADKRAKMLGIWTAIISVATGLGSFIGGTLINLFGWRSIFLVNIPLGLITVISVMMLIKSNVANPKVKIDVINNILLVMTIASLIIYLVEGNQQGYGKFNLLIFIALTFIFAFILFLRERNTTAPIVPHQLLKQPRFLVSNLLGLVVNISLYGIVLVLGLYFQTELHLTPMISGLLIVPGMIVLVIGNLYYAKAVKRIKANVLATRSILFAIMGALGILVMSLITAQVPLYIIILFFAVMSLGIGVLTPATTTMLMEAAGKDFSGIAGATLNANKQIGGLFGTAIMSIVISSFAEQWQMVLGITFLINSCLYLGSWILTQKFLKDSKL